MEGLLNNMTNIAREAGKIILRAGSEQIGVRTKSGFRDVVTKYDVMVQDHTIGQLKAAYPDACFISEESDEFQLEEGGLIFVIDPIDGTANFVHHCQHSCISIGCVRGGKPVAAVVYDPFLDEMFTASRGEGAYLNGEKLMIPDQSLQESLVLFGSSPYYTEYMDETFRILRAVFERCQDVRRSGSAALDLCYVAAGRAGLFYEAVLSVWDYAAGALIVQEAGGLCTTFQRDELVVDRPVKSSVIAAGKTVFEESILLMQGERGVRTKS